MKKQEMRVAIAKDVLSLLKAGDLDAQDSFCYIDEEFLWAFQDYLDTSYLDELSSSDLKKYLNDFLPGRGDCTVCAIGAAVVSGVRQFNSVSGKEFESTEGPESPSATAFFTEEQLSKMEDLFELNVSYRKCPSSFQNTDNRLVVRLETSPRERMEVIYEDIRDHKGFFSFNRVWSKLLKTALERHNNDD